VRTPFLDENLAFFLPSNLLPYPKNFRKGQFILELDIPKGHTGVCPLGASVAGPARAVWCCEEIDILYDSPVAVGPFEHTSFVIDGIEHHHYIEPGHDARLETLNQDLEKICREAGRLMGGFPYPHYTFISLLMKDGHGGLEHLDSSVLLRPRKGFGTSTGNEEFLTLAAHEHFHAWNVKRIRPEVLSAPFAYERENYTPDLWWLEGGTVYYEERIAFRAGIVSRERHLERLANLVKQLARTPGRTHQPIEESSFDAWLKLYRHGEDSINSTVSYYLKGAVVMLALDLELLKRSQGEVSVDTVLKTLCERYGAKNQPYPPGEIERTLLEVGVDKDWLDHHLRSTKEIELESALSAVGLALSWGAVPAGGWLGVETIGDRLIISSVREDGPAWGALSPGDEILGLEGERVWGSGDLAERLKLLAPEQMVRVLVARDGRIEEKQLCLAMIPPADIKIIPIATPTEEQQRLNEKWLYQFLTKD
jgi:predicted metalloprotease with PDZ domain